MKIIDERRGTVNGWEDAGSTTSSSSTSSRLTFQNVLKGLRVPAALQEGEGVDVLRVFANGQTQSSVLSLSEDKFTLYLTSQRKKQKLSNGLGGLFFGRSATTTNTNGNGISSGSHPSACASSGGHGDVERAIDIGAIDRIQRGHTTKRFELARINRINSSSQLQSPTALAAAAALGEEVDSLTLLHPAQCFSILFRGDWTLDLMVLSSGEERDKILDALDAVLRSYQEQKRRVSADVLLLRYHWLDAVNKKDPLLNANQLQKLLQKMNYSMKQRDLDDVYQKFGSAIGLDRRMRRKGLTFEQTCAMLHRIKRDTWTVKPITQAWNRLFGEFMKNGKPRMTVSDKTFLQKFLVQTQGEKATLEDVRKLFSRLNALELPLLAGESTIEKDPTRIDKNRFETYLLLEENDAFDPSRQRFDEASMLRPISEYWINSSHNTYLTGDQFTSHSSVDMYSNALYRGCRCLELDLWDGDIGDDGLPCPVVWHGHTMTSKILFKDIIKAVKLYLNFHPDTFPLILSFENHCSIPYQETMADQLVKILGKSLYIPKEESLNERLPLPSPMDLRGMVVIKGRRPSNLNYDDYDTDDDVSDDGAPSTIFSGDTSVAQQMQQGKVHHGISPALARLTLFHGTKMVDWETSNMNPNHHMHSFSENKLRSRSRRTDRHMWTIHNQSHMCRIYPAGSRIDSSNYVPILGWSLGCQMVSLNFQTADIGLFLNDGRFRENGGCGYVHKPPDLLELQKPQTAPPMPMVLSIRILSGSCLPKPKLTRGDKCIDPYVKVSVYDVKNGVKEESSSFQTAPVYNNGFFPIWNEEAFTFVVESWPSAMIQLMVMDKEVAPSSDEFVAKAAIPISCLRQGLRSVKLTDSTNTRSGPFDFASLLIEVKKTRGLESTKKVARRSSGPNPTGSTTTKPSGYEGLSIPSDHGPSIERSRGSTSSRHGSTKLSRSRTDQSKDERELAEF